MRTIPAIVCTLLLTLLLASKAGAEKPVPQIEHVMIVSVDGLRPDLMLRADTPNMRNLYESGSFSFWARTTAMSVTLPSHVSMLTGVVPNRHAILWNGDLATVEPVYPRVPTLFELAKKSGYSTALAAGKTKFSFLNKPETIDHAVLLDAKEDVLVAEAAAELIREHRPNVLMVHMPVVDVAGHTKGWGTPEQLAAVEKADEALGIVLEALRETELIGKTLIILTADHGGAGRTHGPDDPRSRTIPWIAAGPGIRQNYDLTRVRELEINTEDTCATALAFLAIAPTVTLDGKPITQILEERELLSDAPRTVAP